MAAHNVSQFYPWVSSKRVLIVGSSHVRRLKRFIDLEFARPNFGVAAAEVQAFGEGGMKIDDLLNSNTARKFDTFQPHVAVVMIGGNDVLDIGDANLLAKRLIAVVSTMRRRFSLEHVYVVQILPRFLRNFRQNKLYDDIARETNIHLLQEVLPIQHISLVQFAFARFLCERPRQYYRLRKLYWDRVHLNGDGYQKLCRSLRNTIIQATRLRW